MSQKVINNFAIKDLIGPTNINGFTEIKFNE